jgi:hypothetical protein
MFRTTVEEEFVHFLLTVVVKSASNPNPNPNPNPSIHGKVNVFNGVNDGVDDNNIDTNPNPVNTNININNDEDNNPNPNPSPNPNHNINIARKLLYQMSLLDRFQTIIKLTLFGNDHLKISLLKTIHTILINESYDSTTDPNPNSDHNSNPTYDPNSNPDSNPNYFPEKEKLITADIEGINCRGRSSASHQKIVASITMIQELLVS